MKEETRHIVDKRMQEQATQPPHLRFWAINEKNGRLVQFTSKSYRNLLRDLVQFENRSPKEKRAANRTKYDNDKLNFRPCTGPTSVDQALSRKTAFQSVGLQKEWLALNGAPVEAAPAAPAKAPKKVKFFGEMTVAEMKADLKERFPDREDEWSKVRNKAGLLKWESEQEGGAE